VSASGNLRAVLGSRPFRRLLGVRLISQFGDGLFQSALAGSLLFSPEKAPDGLRVATAFAVLLLPYSLVGPFVGVFLDRWSRRNVIYAANLIRAVMVVPMTMLTWSGQEGFFGYALGALMIIGINRFVLAGLSASQPHVVPADRLVTANALATTLGTVHYTLGLGVAGLRHLGGRPVAAYPLVAQGAFRILYGVLALATLLLYRRYFYPNDPTAALAGLTQVIAAGGLGSLLAAFITPPAGRRLGGWRWISGLLAGIGLLVFAFGLPFVPILLVIAVFFVSIGAQGIKIVVDTTIQQECHDDFRGRVFSVNDTTYNVCFVIGLFGAALALPDNGRSVPGILLVGAGYLAVAAWFGMAAGRVAARSAAAAGPSAALTATAQTGRRLD